MRFDCGHEDGVVTARSKIEWTDRTWNPVTGCTKVSAGCDHCYAETIAERFRGGASFPNGFDVQLRESKLGDPLRWRKPSKVFVNSMSDLFHDEVSDAFIAKVFAVMARAERHTFQILTKRHARMRSLLSSDAFHENVFDLNGVADPKWTQYRTWPLPNVCLGVSVEDQKWADIRIPALLSTPAAVRFISAEPLLGPIDLSCLRCPCGDCKDPNYGPLLDWVIVGGESGHGARPMHPQWARDMRDQCIRTGVAFHFKQWGEWVEWSGPTSVGFDRYTMVELAGDVHPPLGKAKEALARGAARMQRVGKKAAGRELDGRTWDEAPPRRPAITEEVAK